MIATMDEISGQDRSTEKPAKETVALNIGLLLLALVALGVAAWTVVVDQFRAGVDDLFLVLVCLLIALMASINPVLWAHSNGYLRNPFAADDEAEGEEHGGSAEVGSGELHPFEGSNRLFVTVWLALLGLTGIEVILAYEQVPANLMVIILMCASIVKAALIMAYFMHLRFERMSLILTLVPAMLICISLLTIFFPDSFRLSALRQLLR